MKIEETLMIYKQTIDSWPLMVTISCGSVLLKRRESNENFVSTEGKDKPQRTQEKLAAQFQDLPSLNRVKQKELFSIAAIRLDYRTPLTVMCDSRATSSAIHRNSPTFRSLVQSSRKNLLSILSVLDRKRHLSVSKVSAIAFDSIILDCSMLTIFDIAFSDSWEILSDI